VKVVFSDNAWEDYLHWQSAAPNTLQRVNDLIKECQRTPFKGTGKPEPLKGDLSAPDQQLEIAQCRFHY
jgi:toxin YoeB